MKKLFLLSAVFVVLFALLIGCTALVTTILTSEPPESDPSISDQPTPEPGVTTPPPSTPGPDETGSPPNETDPPPVVGSTNTLTFQFNRNQGSLVGTAVQILEEFEPSTAVTARAAPGFRFDGWSDGAITATRSGLIITQDTTITALFSPISQLNTIHYMASPPRGGTISGRSQQSLATGERSSEVRAVAAVGFRFAGWSDNPNNTTPTRRDTLVTGDDLVIYAIFVPINLVVPTMRIDTNNVPMRPDQVYIPATVSTSGARNPAHNFSNLSAQIRGRGNSSWDFFRDTKPSYRLRLDDPRHLFGVGQASSRHWILFSSHGEPTFLRGWSMMRLGQLMSGIPKVTDSMHINLYLNGDFRGIYMLIEHFVLDSINDSNRNQPHEMGFLVELNSRAWGQPNPDKVLVINNPGFYAYPFNGTYNRPFYVRSNIPSPAHLNYIRQYIQRVHNAFLTGDYNQISALVDIPSLIDMFILQELSNNRDVGLASFYMYKTPGGLLYFAIPWDFDISLGQDFRHSWNNASHGLMTFTGFCRRGINIVEPGSRENFRGNLWFLAVARQTWFLEMVIERMQELNPIITHLISEISIMAGFLAPHVELNRDRWWGTGTFPNGNTWNWTYQQHVNFLTDWMRQRWTFLNNEFRWLLNNR